LISILFTIARYNKLLTSIAKRRQATMKENYTQLYPNEQVSKAVGDYAYEHSTKLPKHITDHHAWATATQERANYMISPIQAQFHVWIAKAVGAKRGMFRSTLLDFELLVMSLRPYCFCCFLDEVRCLLPFRHEILCLSLTIISVNITSSLPRSMWEEDMFLSPCLHILSFDLWPAGSKDYIIPEPSLKHLTVLEIGTYIGFSTMGWSSAVGPDGHVTALEFSPEYAAIAEESFAKNGIKNIDIVVGDARDS
jgi:hypothetical protein